MRGVVLIGVLAVVLVGILAGGCAGPQEAQYMRLGGIEPTDAEAARGPQDLARCRYGAAQVSAASAGPVAVPSGRYAYGAAIMGSNMVQNRLYDQTMADCMASAGWVRVR